MEVINTTSTTNPVNMYNSLNSFILKPIVIIIIVIVIICFVVFSSSLGNNASFNIPGNENSSQENSSKLIVSIILVIIIILVLLHALQYFFSINMQAYVQNIFQPNPQVDVVVNSSQKTTSSSTVPEIKYEKQVYNIPGNYYDYENAQALCQAYGSTLASYNQIEESYNKGAEWCNYGWSADQMAFFPTQQKTYDHLQTVSGHQNDCGRPGINGGYMANPNIRFGVNCYGYKPKITKEENELMKSVTPYPETAQDQSFQKRVDFWKTKIDNILVSPFNYNKWTSPLI